MLKRRRPAVARTGTGQLSWPVSARSSLPSSSSPPSDGRVVPSPGSVPGSIPGSVPGPIPGPIPGSVPGSVVPSSVSLLIIVTVFDDVS